MASVAHHSSVSSGVYIYIVLAMASLLVRFRATAKELPRQCHGTFNLLVGPFCYEDFCLAPTCRLAKNKMQSLRLH